jgi:hypothetical protein
MQILVWLSAGVTALVDNLCGGASSAWTRLEKDFLRVSRVTKTVRDMWKWFNDMCDYAMSYVLDEQSFFDRLAAKYPATQHCIVQAQRLDAAPAVTPRQVREYALHRALARADEARVPKMLLASYKSWTAKMCLRCQGKRGWRLLPIGTSAHDALGAPRRRQNNSDPALV